MHFRHDSCEVFRYPLGPSVALGGISKRLCLLCIVARKRGRSSPKSRSSYVHLHGFWWCVPRGRMAEEARHIYHSMYRRGNKPSSFASRLFSSLPAFYYDMGGRILGGGGGRREKFLLREEFFPPPIHEDEGPPPSSTIRRRVYSSCDLTARDLPMEEDRKNGMNAKSPRLRL